MKPVALKFQSSTVSISLGNVTLIHHNAVSSSRCLKQLLPSMVTDDILALTLGLFPTFQLSKTLGVWSLLSWNFPHLFGEKTLSTYASALKIQRLDLNFWIGRHSNKDKDSVESQQGPRALVAGGTSSPLWRTRRTSPISDSWDKMWKNVSSGEGIREVTYTRRGGRHGRCTEYRATQHLWGRPGCGNRVWKGQGRVWALQQLVHSLQLVSEGQRGNSEDFKWKKTCSSFASQ